MAIRKYKEVSMIFRDYASDNIGVSKDAYIRDKDATVKTYNYGGSSYLYCGGGPTNGNYHIVLKIVMPEDSDFTNFGKLIKAELILRIDYTSLPTTLIIGVVSIEDIWDEGVLNGAIGACNWTDAQIGPVVWQNAGAIKSRFNSISTDDGTIYDTKSILGAGVELKLDLTDALSMGDDKTFVIFPISSSASNVFMYFDSTEHFTAGYRPGLKITYRDYAVDAFDKKDDALTIEPNPDNPEQPLLKWGGVDEEDFVDFKLYRSTSPITSVSTLTPIATITDNSDQEYVDTGSHTDGTKYYYMVIAEDGNNTGNDATFSKNVSFTKPKVTSATITPTGNQTVGTKETLTVVSPQNIKRLFINWGDGLGTSSDIESWYEYETVGTSKKAYHIYSMQTGGVGVSLYARVEDELGFWSSLIATGNTVTLIDSNPTAKLRVNVHKVVVGDEVTLDATLSQPVASNVTITSYKFWRYAGDASPVTQTSPVFTFLTTGFSVGSKTGTVQITTSSGKTATDTATYEVESGLPTELAFSRDTKIHELNHGLGQSKVVEIPIGSNGVEHEFLISRHAERITLVGTSNHPNTGTDIDIIRTAWLNNQYVRFTVLTEMENKKVQYDCKIDGDISLGQSFDNKQSWTFPVRVIVRTEI